MKIRVFANTDGVNKDSLREVDFYRISLLRLALEKASRPAELVIRSHLDISLGQKAFINLLDIDRIDIAWSMTSKQREAAALPIRVPIYRGLMGWRIGFIRTNDKPRFYRLSQAEDLKQVLTGQGHDWPDTAILRHNGFKVEPGLVWSARFKMLAAGRYDYFPRSVVEIWDEQSEVDSLSVEIEPKFAIYYPTAFYFFVNKARQDIANLVTEGLMQAVSDGSFHELFMRFHSDSIKRANLENREVLYLENPLLSAETPIEDERLWYHPQLKTAH